MASLMAAYSIYADDGAGNNMRSSKGSVKVQFHNHALHYSHEDSVLIIFDRYNRSGAGVLLQVFHADSNHRILIPEIPAGKYFVTIQFLGVHHDQWNKVVWVRPKKCGLLRLRLEKCEEYTKVIIPEYKPDLSHLSIVRIRARGGPRQSKSFPLF